MTPRLPLSPSSPLRAATAVPDPACDREPTDTVAGEQEAKVAWDDYNLDDDMTRILKTWWRVLLARVEGAESHDYTLAFGLTKDK